MASGDPFLLTIAFYLNVVRTKRDMRVRPYLLVFAKCDIRLKIELFFQHYNAHHPGGYFFCQSRGQHHLSGWAEFLPELCISRCKFHRLSSCASFLLI